MKLRTCFLILLLAAPALGSDRRITVVHFSDYHAHAVPFHANGEPRSAGLARAINYLEGFADDPKTLVFSGGDMLNLGAPPWSDKFGCADWAWFNGIVDAMAWGNHDADYGPEAFALCRKSIDYPILGANVVDPAGDRIFDREGNPYLVFERDGLRVGVFAAVGDEFVELVGPARLPVPGARFTSREAAAREVVKALRERERADVVILIGHAQKEEDVALARAVPGIDLILGTHSHRREPLARIDGSDTWIVSPGQYLSTISRVDITIESNGTKRFGGELVAMNSTRPENRTVARRVRSMDRALRRDPKFAPLYRTVGRAAVGFSTDGSTERDASLPSFVLDMMRSRSGADLALSTASSFREPIAAGAVRGVDLLAALPYENEILVYELPGDVLARIIDYSLSRRGSDFFAQVSGLRIDIDGDRASGIAVATREGGWAPLDPSRTYSVATTNYLALVAGGYREFFAGRTPRSTGIRVRDEVRRMFAAGRPLRPPTDRRIHD